MAMKNHKIIKSLVFASAFMATSAYANEAIYMKCNGEANVASTMAGETSYNEYNYENLISYDFENKEITIYDWYPYKPYDYIVSNCRESDDAISCSLYDKSYGNKGSEVIITYNLLIDRYNGSFSMSHLIRDSLKSTIYTAKLAKRTIYEGICEKIDGVIPKKRKF